MLSRNDKYNGFYVADEEGRHLYDARSSVQAISKARSEARRTGEVRKAIRAYGGRFPERTIYTSRADG